MAYLNQDLQFDEVRWSTDGKSSYDARLSFAGEPRKVLLPAGRQLYRLVPLFGGNPFESPWWMPEETFESMIGVNQRAAHGGGAQLRNLIVEGLSLPSNNQLSVVVVKLDKPVFAWQGLASQLRVRDGKERPGGLAQIYLPRLGERGEPGWSPYAHLVRTYWLKFAAHGSVR